MGAETPPEFTKGGNMAHASILIPSDTPSRIQLVQSPRDLTGGMQTVAIEDVGDKRYYHYAQPTGFITNDNERQRVENPDWNHNSEMRQVASIPNVVWQLWESMGITLDQKELRKAIQRHKDSLMVVDKRLI